MTDLPQTRQSLLIELGRKSDDAWVEFLEVYEHAIYRVCCSRGFQDADARDVTQEVLTAVHQRIATWKHDPDKGTFRGWLMRVARNVCVDTLRQHGRRTRGSGDSLVEEMLREVPDANGEDRTRFDLEYERSMYELAARKVRDEVRDVTWRCFQLTAVHGKGAQAVAEELGVPVGSVYTAKCRVVARIRARVEALEKDA